MYQNFVCSIKITITPVDSKNLEFALGRNGAITKPAWWLTAQGLGIPPDQNVSGSAQAAHTVPTMLPAFNLYRAVKNMLAM